MEKLLKIIKKVLSIFFNKEKEQPKIKQTICLDAGHGGRDPGAQGENVDEKELTLDFSKHLSKLLEEKGAITAQTRKKDIYVTLQDRVDLAKKVGTDLFVSLHCNAAETASAYGIETYIHPDASMTSKKIADKVQEELINVSSTQDRGVRKANFYVLRETPFPAILIEFGFLTNPEEEAKLKDPEYRQILCEATVKAIYEYYTEED